VRHPLTGAVRRALPRPLSEDHRAYLALLDRRLQRLESLASSGVTSVPEPRTARALARRFLRPLEGQWDDGDENLVRDHVDRWTRPGQDPAREAARRLTEAARALAGLESRPGTLWCFLWLLESMLESSAAESPTNPRRSR
jgi:hypothetical protein